VPDSEEALDSALGWVADHTRRYVDSDGEDGHEWMGVPTLILTTRGRRSGRLRRNALIYGTDGDDHIIVASRGGHANNPLWYLNLVEDPKVGVQVGADRFDATARTATAEEKARLWPAMTKIWPAYDEYQSKTERDIPVVLLERIR
jgi:deazaflavin-dependent oxidoreductase (nitroreductase family)